MHGPVYNFFKKEGDMSFWINIIFMSILAGMASSGLLVIITLASKSSVNGNVDYQYLAIYIVIFYIFYITKKIILMKSGTEVERIIKNTRYRIYNKIRNSELISLENIDYSQTLRRLARNGTTISQSSTILISIAQSMIMIFFVFIYILYLSPEIFLISFSLILIGIIIYILMGKNLIYYIRKNRKVEDKFFNALNLVIHSFKELRVNSKKRNIISEETNEALDDLLASRINLIKKSTFGVMFSEVFLYVILGIIVFIIPHLKSEDSITIIQAIAAMLFVIGYIEDTLAIAPNAIKTVSSIQSITRLEKALNNGLLNKQIRDDNTISKFKDFKNISLKNVKFYYKNDYEENIFGIGPINLNIKRGEIIFIVGSNGSGKSTFIKTLLALYQADIGAIYIDNNVIARNHYQIYRDLFSIILSDFYIFDEVYGVEDIDYNLVNDLLVEMKIEKKTEFINGKFSNINLSTGQKKRLALIIMILEDKPIYIFDELTADQDPEFRKYFYQVILKRLKERGKTIIAVTHDDSYFNIADRVLMMDDGQISQYKGKI